MTNLKTILSFIIAIVIFVAFFTAYDKDSKECMPYRNDQQQFNQYPKQ